MTFYGSDYFQFANVATKKAQFLNLMGGGCDVNTSV